VGHDPGHLALQAESLPTVPFKRRRDEDLRNGFEFEGV
jgi:hypothetical protein